MIIKNKNGSKELGLGIIVFAMLILIFGIFQDPSLDNLNQRENSGENSFTSGNSDLPENYIFYLNEIELGKQKKQIQNFPNIQLGSKEEFKTTYIEQGFKISDNFLNSIPYKFSYKIDSPENLEELLLYANIEVLSGSRDIEILINGNNVLKIQPKNRNIPISINKNKLKLNDTNIIEIRVERVPFYNIFSWNKISFSDFKVVEKTIDRTENEKEFSFQVQEDSLEKSFVDIVVSCKDSSKKGENIQIEVNDYILTNRNPDCKSNFNRISVEIPKNILRFNEPNTLTLKTNGYYKLAYSIKSIYFNDIDQYLFVINDFSDVFDIVISGDFDRSSLLIKINGKRLELKRGDYLSILSYIRFGTNKLEILNKPVSIKELIIEKIDFRSEGFN